MVQGASGIVQEAPATPIKLAAAVPKSPPTDASPFVSGTIGPTAGGHGASGSRRQEKVAATLSGPFSGLSMGDDAAESDGPTVVHSSVRRVSLTKTRNGLPMEEPANASAATKKKPRRGAKQKNKKLFNPHDVPSGPEASPDFARKPNGKGAGRGKGWRSTPLLQEELSMPPNQPTNSNSAQKKTRKQRAAEATNGWATEDATDVQELPDFDFEANLSKFDKRSVFDQIRNEDTTADEERLVSHNRVPAARPGTYGGKALHPTENVMDSRTSYSRSGDFIDESDSSEVDFDNSGRASRVTMSRISGKPSRTRQSSLQDEASQILSGSSHGHLSRSHRMSRPTQAATGSPRLRATVQSPSFQSPTRPHFLTAESGWLCM